MKVKIKPNLKIKYCDRTILLDFSLFINERECILSITFTALNILDLVGSEYLTNIHFYGRSLGKSFLTIGGKVVHLGEVFSYVAFLQKNYGLTPDQLGQSVCHLFETTRFRLGMKDWEFFIISGILNRD